LKFLPKNIKPFFNYFFATLTNLTMKNVKVFRKPFLFITITATIFVAITILLLSPWQKSVNQLSDLEQYEKFKDASFEDIETLPKYDRPDLAVMQNFDMTKDPATNLVPVSKTLQAFTRIKKDWSRHKAALGGVNWSERGPNNVGGRTRALMFDPNDGTGTKVWAGGVAGGLWYNNNITSSSSQWQNVNDFWANLAISSIAYDPLNTQVFYVGTGEGFFNADAVQGAGIWKTIDGGSTWSQLSSTDNSNFYYVQKVVVTPSGTVLAATREGFYRSTDGGSSWTSLYTGRFADIEVASNGDIYASEGIFTDGIVRKSTNDGVSWTTVTPTTGGQRIELAIAPSDPNTIYAVASFDTDIAWFRKSTNGGSSWTTVTIPAYTTQSCSLSGTDDFARGQAWYDLIVSVHPTNPNIVLVGGIDIYKSTNGGSSWGLISYWTGSCDTYVHADQHAMQFSPVNSNVAIFGNDGGVFYSSNVGNASNPSIVARNNGYNVTQFYAADQANTGGSNYMLAGAQDNGSQQFNTAGVNSTNEVTGGDGAFCHIDQLNSNYQVTSYVYNSYYRSTNGGSSFSSILSNTSYGRFINPTEYDDNAKVLYAAANEDQYIRITNMTGSTSANVNSASLGGYRVSAIKTSPYTNNRIFLATGVHRGTGGSKIFRVDNANGSSPTVTEIGTASLPGNGYISSIDIGSSENQLIITYSNYGLTSVWETRNGGSSWVDREGNLPDIPIRWALYNPANTNEVLLATELGVWSTDNINVTSPNWGVTNTGLANVRCDMLQYRDSDGKVLVATHGRGVYTASPFTGGSDTEAPSTPTNLSSSNITSSSFDISWTASTDNVGVTGYNVYLDGSLDGSTASTSYSFSGLNPSTTYAVAVEASDAASNVSGQATLDVTTSPGAGSCAATVSSFPYNQSFETGTGNWVQETTDDLDWTRDASGTPSSGTGPSTGADGSYYMYIEASVDGTGFPNKNAIIYTPCFDVSSLTIAELSFSYHMNGTAMGNLVVELSTDEGSTWTSLWSISGSQGDVWNEVKLDLPSGSGLKIRFNGTTGSSWSSDIAIDNVGISEKSTGGFCTTTISSFPYNQSFESSIGSWEQNSTDDLDWTRDASGTPSTGTGPSTGADGSYYLYIEASGDGTGYPNKNAIINTPCFDVSSLTEAELLFSYHMNGTSIGNLIVETSTDGGSTWSNLWSISGSQGNVWNEVKLDLPSATGLKIRFNGTTGSSWSSDIAIDNVTVAEKTTGPSCPPISFGTIFSYGGTQDAAGDYAVQDGNTTLFLENNTWKYISYNYTVTANTVIEFEFRSTSEGEIHGIGLDADNTISSDLTFKVHGNQNWGITNYDNYTGTSWVKYVIPVGSFYTGSFDRIFFVNDYDAGSGNNSYFRNVLVHEGECGAAYAEYLTNWSKQAITPIIGNEGEFDVRLFPNPVQNELTLRHGYKEANYSILTMSGKLLYKGSINEQNEFKIKTSELSSGMYILKIDSKEGNRTMRFSKK